MERGEDSHGGPPEGALGPHWGEGLEREGVWAQVPGGFK